MYLLPTIDTHFVSILLLVYILILLTPYLLLINMGGISGRGGIKRASANQLMCQQGPYFSPHSKAKANYKSTNLRKIGN